MEHSMSFSSLWQQFFPPAPSFTEKDVTPGSGAGKVFIVTGANAGIGLALVKILYPTGATIYLAGRSVDKTQKAIAEITSLSSPATPAKLKILQLDLADLASVKAAAASVASQETRLDILWNNASTNLPGSNCVAPLLFTEELLPLLQAAAKSAPKDRVRVIWTGSLHIDMTAPKVGVDFTRIEDAANLTVTRDDYAASKAGNYFLATEAARRWGASGVISVCQNPGNLYTGMYDNEPALLMFFLKRFVLYETKYGAYTMLFAGLSSEVNESSNGAYIWPWGRIRPLPRADILEAVSNGRAAKFWEWCERHGQSIPS
ncbi:hypothetical protein KVR01_013597 [Diaporthe batatas]|uniref:uncharacterized protein n=1 Tax=Diaporthe batatas TaxID=748121 RepID=UPI001D04DD03|nr:uncharacterized protein KVR01_013597 [Diaporthe batatas]KAG8156493.1 hypothetical protein KVR01_013597 [Diaporthe batatas]